jgi:hypothetical protein
MIKHISELRVGDTITFVHGESAVTHFFPTTRYHKPIRVIALAYHLAEAEADGTLGGIDVTVTSGWIDNPQDIKATLNFPERDLVELEPGSAEKLSDDTVIKYLRHQDIGHRARVVRMSCNSAHERTELYRLMSDI